MTVTTVFATAPGGGSCVRSENATYATARASGTLSASNPSIIGQQFTGSVYRCFESFVLFDTSGIPDTDTVSGVVLTMDGGSSPGVQQMIYAALDDYDGGAAVAGDWVNGTTLSGLSVLAEFDSDDFSNGANVFTDTGLFSAALNKTGNTPLMLFSSRHSGNNTPTTQEWLTFVDADESGTTTDPKLDITHAEAGGGTVVKDIIGTGLIAFAR